MHLPAFDEEFDPGNLDKICENLCLGLKFSLPRWELFLLEPEKRQSRKYKGFQEHVWDYIMKGGNQRSTRRQSTKASADVSVTDQGQEEQCTVSEVSFGED
jgi:hypothetical protein